MQIKRSPVRQSTGTLANVKEQGLWDVSSLFRELSCGSWPCSLGIHGRLPGYPTLRDSGVHTHQSSVGVL